MTKEEKNDPVLDADASLDDSLSLVCDGASVCDSGAPVVGKKMVVLQRSPLKDYAFAKLGDWLGFSFLSGLVTASWVVLFYFLLRHMGVF